MHFGDLKALALPPNYEIPCNGSTITLDATASSQGPGLIYEWKTDDGLLVSGGNTLTPKVALVGNSNQPGNSYHWTAGLGAHIVSGANSPVAMVDQPGDYSLVVTDPISGCTAEAVITVLANWMPATVTIQAPGKLGGGTDTLTLSASVTPANATAVWTHHQWTHCFRGEYFTPKNYLRRPVYGYCDQPGQWL